MIYINGIPSLRNSDVSDDLNVDDRKEKIPLINGVDIQNGGKYFGGVTLSCCFTAANFELVKALWLADQKVSYTDKAGVTYSDLTLKFNKWKKVDSYHNYIQLDFELMKETNVANNL